jgi:GT2 family glycosyltransferase
MTKLKVDGERVRLVCATRSSRSKFFAESALARSLAAQQHGNFEWLIFDENGRGLADVYNEAIGQSMHDPAILVFIHDDIWICDFFWIDQLRAALRSFDVVGLAGNQRRLPRQPSWAFVDESLRWDDPEYLSGVVGWGNGFPPEGISYFGRSGVEVRLLDGLLMAVRSETLWLHQVNFDERFSYHFYDMDFCRQCEAKGVRMGTWPISVVHQSGGSFGSLAWRAAYIRYLDKWMT